MAGRFTIGREHEKLHQAAHTDGLKGLLNRTAFAPLFDACTADAAAGQGGLVAALMDIDYFKRVNDTYGHAVGDEALRIVATAIRSSVRDTDPVFRWGGEEFLLLLPMADLPQALARLEALRDRLRGTPIEVPQPAGAIYVNLSFGVGRHRKGESSAGLLQRADRALYDAKNSGRDCIAVDQES
ncbi:GGDEF domain-containing protein [Synechococcus sp. CB0101]|uniref:GGDEF domain-containing protein n=1 Tax=Synechococcus sp. CB0101 TaxID=232348 RepID=UPI001FEFBD05|nr:GGDEF domain-containing protein [Synechococcus sp. CB0101]